MIGLYEVCLVPGMLYILGVAVVGRLTIVIMVLPRKLRRYRGYGCADNYY